MSDKLNKFKDVLKEIFQLDQADLDFGIYRIMNQKRADIENFLENDLLPQVKKQFEGYNEGETSHFNTELAKAEEDARSLGVDPENLPKIKELKSRINSAQNIDILADNVFSHLTTFFKRYYDEGDFLSQRRYKKDVYSIPYQGEEVKLYWANYDQYYIKTSEYFKNYAFRLDNEYLIRFKINDASTEQNNNLNITGKNRRFFIDLQNPMNVLSDCLEIGFSYDFREESQKNLTDEAISVITQLFNEKLKHSAEFINYTGLFAPRPTEKNKKRTLLEKHINDFTSRNTFDYFIHKDLGGFLRRELDYYIKNEVLFIDDINEREEQEFHKQVITIKVLKTIGHKIITFLEQLENFQKKLWLKKKFVIETNYCITIDRIPKELYPEIINNTAQIEEWKRLYAIDEITTDLTRVGYSEPLTVEFLEQNQFLVVDTKHFQSDSFKKIEKSSIKACISMDGLLLNCDNFHGLRLIYKLFFERIKSIYIDPPYNTNASELIYKNNFKHSAWISFLYDRLLVSKNLLEYDGVFCITIDHVELHNLRLLIGEIFDEDNILGLVSIKNNPSGRSTVKGLSISNEFAVFIGASDFSKIGFIDRDEEQIAQYPEYDDMGNFQWRYLLRSGGMNDFRTARPKLFYPIVVRGDHIRLPELRWDKDTRSYKLIDIIGKDEVIIYPVSKGIEYSWRLGVDSLKSRISDLRVRLNRNNQRTIEIKFRASDEGILPKSIWDSKMYNSTAYGTSLIRNFFGVPQLFTFPKSLYAVIDCIKVSGINYGSYVLDYFAGSGTTAHAIIELNRQDQGNRKYILMEMGEYCETVTIPRIKKAIYSKEWKDGKPVDREGISHCFKYQKLESYEDTLNNLRLARTNNQQEMLELDERFREGYMLSYMLDVETAGSDSLLNLDGFEDPFNYYLNVTENYELKPTKVDLIETFNYLIGLNVESYDTKDGYVWLTGKTTDEENVIVIWRNLNEKSNQDLNDFFKTIRVNPRDREFDRIYVNGDNFLENIKIADEKWKVVLIEEEFKKRMFEE